MEWTWFQASRTSGQYDLNLATSGASTRYFYDGQMGMEDDYNPSGSVTKVNRYGLGARGIDRIEHWDGSTTSYAYPIYDGHGNARAMLYRSGSSYGTQNWRTYDVWGSVRSNDTTSPNPTQRYCASLGHVADDDSGLIYMRARYHEPSTGRFISEDPACDGLNWYTYAANNPIRNVDQSGTSVISVIIGLMKLLIGEMLMGVTGQLTTKIENIERHMAQLESLIAGANSAAGWADDALALRKEYMALSRTLNRYKIYQKMLKWGSAVANVLAKLAGYSLIISVFIDDIDLSVDGQGATDILYG